MVIAFLWASRERDSSFKMAVGVVRVWWALAWVVSAGGRLSADRPDRPSGRAGATRPTPLAATPAPAPLLRSAAPTPAAADVPDPPAAADTPRPDWSSTPAFGSSAGNSSRSRTARGTAAAP